MFEDNLALAAVVVKLSEQRLEVVVFDCGFNANRMACWALKDLGEVS